MNGQPTGTGSDPNWQAIAAMQGQTSLLQAGPLQAAKNQQIQSIQSGLSVDMMNIVKMFGDRARDSGANISAPFTTASGGMPLLTPSGGLIGSRT
jgi:hypothetical protein